MQQIFDEIAKRLLSQNPDSDALLAMLDELHTVEMELPACDYRQALKNVAIVYNLAVPECVE